jgi:hypothetical protein
MVAEMDLYVGSKRFPLGRYTARHTCWRASGRPLDAAQKIVGMLAIWVYIVMPHYGT